MKPLLLLALTVAAFPCFAENLRPAAAGTEASALKTRLPIKMISRWDWAANPPTGEMKTHKPQFLTIHHTATKQLPNKSAVDKLRGLQNFSQHESTLADGHKKKAWPDVPYHFYITCKGELVEGRELQYVGDTNTEYDPTGHILVTLEGNFETEQPTDAQMEVTKKLVSWMAREYRVPRDRIASHKDYAKTACPGKNLYARLDEIRDAAVKR